MPKLLSRTTGVCAGLLLAGVAAWAQGRLIGLSDEPGKFRPWKYQGFSAQDLRAAGATAADASAFEQRMKQLADVLKASPVWNPPKGVDALLSGSGGMPVPPKVTPLPYQPLAGDILVGTFEIFDIDRGDGRLERGVAGETNLAIVGINRLLTAGGRMSLGDVEGDFTKQPVQTGDWAGFPIFDRDVLVITANGRLPWAAVTRERYLKAFVGKRRGEAANAETYIADQQKKLDAFMAPDAVKARQDKYAAAVAKVAARGDASAADHERRYWERDEADALAALKKGASRDPKVSPMAATVAGLKAAEDQLAAMPAAERGQQACYLETNDPLKNGLVPAGTPACAMVVAPDVRFFDRRLAPGIPQIITVSRFAVYENAWKKGRPKAGSSDGAMDSWTTYEMLRLTDWKKVAELLGK